MKKLPEKLPNSPGVYFFLDKKGEILYIGKATSLRSRVRSYFGADIGEKRGPLIEKMMQGQGLNIKFQKTDSVLEALLLEAELIKKHMPPYNSKGKDEKSWNYVVITDEKFPRVLIVRGRELESGNFPVARGSRDASPDEVEIDKVFGPFTNSNELKTALKIVRRIFPFRDRCEPNTKPCFNYQIGLCPGVCVGKISEKEYKKTIQNIKLFFKGKKKALVKNLEKEMKRAAKKRQFEEADKIKHQIFALQHINDIALVREKYSENLNVKGFRIEAYDISHISGTNIVGVFTVVENGEIKKSDYRMFKIRGQLGPDDTKALGEVLERRLKHTEWPMPDLIVVDGGSSQLNIARLKIENFKLKIPSVSVVKDEKHKPKDILGDKEMAKRYKKEILLANSESHRFALAFHRRLRSRLT